MPATSGAQEQDIEWTKLGWWSDKVPKVIVKCILGHFGINTELLRIRNDVGSFFFNFEVKGQ